MRFVFDLWALQELIHDLFSKNTESVCFVHKTCVCVCLQVIHRHFYLKRVEIMAQCEGWICDIQQYSSDKRVGRTMSHHAAALKVHHRVFTVIQPKIVPFVVFLKAIPCVCFCRGTRLSSEKSCWSFPVLKAWSRTGRSFLIKAPRSWWKSCPVRMQRSRRTAQTPTVATASYDPEAPPNAFDYPLILKKDWMALVIKPSFCQYLYVRI